MTQPGSPPSPQPVSSVIIEADGGSRGNPGPAGYGAVVRDALTGEVLAERGAGLGSTTNNVAEYSGLIAGLQAAAELGATQVEARMDSKLVVEQMSGRWQVREPRLKVLAGEAAALVRQFNRVRFTWIPRAQNRHADRLANEAMDEQAGGAAAQRQAQSQRDVAGPQGGSESATAGEGFGGQVGPAAWAGRTGVPTRMLLLRHGQTERSAQHRYSGRADVPLTGLGEQQAKAVAERLALREPAVAAVITSPLQRCTHTAELVAAALGAPVVVHEGLIETDFGTWEGLTFAEAAERDRPLHARWLADPAVAAPGGESMDAVHRRVRRARDDLIARYGAATLVVISHVTPIKALLRMALDAGPQLYFRLQLDPASLSVAEFYPDGAAAVRLMNQVCD